MKKRMSTVDAAMILVESHEAPQHGSALLILREPADAPADYMQQLFAQMREHPVTADKFNYVLARGIIDRAAPAWDVLAPDQIDIDYHFRHSALPAPGGELELGVLISRLVAHPLDMSRPPWEVHLIEGLADHRFAIFMKMHHAMIDGMTAMSNLRRWLSDDPAATSTPLWALENEVRKPRDKPASTSQLARVAGAAKAPFSILPEVGGALRKTIGAARGSGDGLVAPYTAPHSVFNGPITQRRRIATQRIELDRVKKLSKASGGTVNDTIAVLLGTAVRRHLAELDLLPERSLVGGVLTSLRAAMEGTAAAEAGNVISFIFADLATDTDDIAERARRVRASTSAGKEHLLGLGRNAMTYTTVMLAPLIGTSLAGQGHRLPRPFYNVGLSNVPGVDTAQYYNGAEVEALHATTIIAHGQAMIVTVTNWNGTLCFTITACPDAVPSPQRVAVYLGEALEEVEAALAKPRRATGDKA